MNFSKVFRRHNPKQSSEKTSFTHNFHGYPRPFSYHIPATEQLSPSSLSKASSVFPYRIGLSGDSALLTNGQTNENDEIVHLPVKNGRRSSPKLRKDRRYQAQLNANKRWLFRSMETLDGWKEKVFPHKNRTTTNQSRSRSVENLAGKETHANILIKPNHSILQEQQRAISPNRSIEAITNRVINSIGIHRKSTNFTPNTVRSPALTIKKQSILTQINNDHNNISQKYTNSHETDGSAILDFREISSIDFLHSRPNINYDHEEISLISSENIVNDINLSDEENEEDINNLSNFTKSYENNNDFNDETSDPWDFSLTWVDSLKEQNSPQRKIQFYENLIKLLEQDTLSIDELLVLRKILAKIWPTNGTATTDSNDQIFSMESKTITTQSLHDPNKIKRRPKLSTMTHHTAQRCSAVIEQSPFTYEQLHEQHSGHAVRPSSVLLTAKAKPCFIENNDGPKLIHKVASSIEHNYPQHLNPFSDEADGVPSNESDCNPSNDSIRRYFERLTLLETIYEKLNIESNKKPSESVHHHPPLSTRENKNKLPSQIKHSTEQRIETKDETRNLLPTDSSNKIDVNKSITNKLLEMNVDGNGSVSSGKSSIKRRAPTAPHLSQNKNSHQLHHSNQKNQNMFTLSSVDINSTQKANTDKTRSPRSNSYDEKLPNENTTNTKVASSTQDTAAACDDNGQIFVYEQNYNQIPTFNKEEQSGLLPKRTERIQQWLSLCETKQESDSQNDLLHLVQNTSPATQLKMRCLTKSIRPTSSSPQNYSDKTVPSITDNDYEAGRFRSCLKINLEKNEPNSYRSRASSATSKYHQRQKPRLDENLNVTESEYFESNTLSPNFQYDHQAVFL